ncbi:PTS transporter subunit EIIC [[Clostridium] innocuum]|nr:PTS transporter subunit EIIC [[Clostridium] innocuum]MCR0577722.1 PTS transporter subunit EIIC [[Clostridium] innocuum]
MAIQKQKLAADILEYVGGVDNVRDVAHCMTRLRIVVKDEKAVQMKQLEGLEGVMKVVILGGQYQIVLGGIVDDIFDEVAAVCGDRVNINEEMIAENLDAETKKGRRSLLGMLVETISAIVTPIIPAMLACGFIKTLAVLFTVVFKVDEANSTIQVLNVVSDTLYAFFPVIIGWSAAKKFKTNMAVSLVIVALLVNPAFTGLFADGANVTFLGIPVTDVYYGSSVLPAILSIYLLSKVEMLLRKIIPGALRSIFVPFLSTLIVFPLLILAIGPIGVWGGNLFASLFTSMYDFSPILAGALIGGTWQILIIFGMHIAILGLVSVPNIAAYGRDTVIMTHAPSLICQVAAGLAVGFKAKNPEIKKNAITLSLTSFFAGSVVEPVMYGVNLKYKRPFIAVCIGGAIGGAITGASLAGTTAAVAFSLYTIPAYLGVGFTGLLIGCGVGACVTFILTWIMGFDEKTI